MQSFYSKKKEFKEAIKNTKSRQLKLQYKNCLENTEKCFQGYIKFYDAFEKLIPNLIKNSMINEFKVSKNSDLVNQIV